jgi:Tol biopolymer transport system component
VRLDAADPGWSPDGGLIVFQAPPDPVPGVEQVIYTIRPDGTGLRVLTPEIDGTASNHPTWSPDGSRVVFAHAPSGPNGGDLFVINRDGTGLHPLAITPLNENSPFWGNAPAGGGMTSPGSA